MRLSNYADQHHGLRSQLARAIGVLPIQISNWASGKRPIPIEYCPTIERATGGAVTRRDLRPNDWWRIWPELVTDEFPAPEPATDMETAP